MSNGFESVDQQIDHIAALKDPVRRALYLYIARQPGEVTRDQAAKTTGISRPLAAFHLDKLVEEGLLQSSFRRLTGRRGPGAGRPSKLYRRSEREFGLTLPPRSYELAASLLARALNVSLSPGTVGVLRDVAGQFGESLGSEARNRAGPDAGRERLLGSAEAVLDDYGFEPYRDGDSLRLRNCPFHALANEYRDLVCGMNLSIMQGLTEGLGVQGIEARLEPQPGECCVAFRETA